VDATVRDADSFIDWISVLMAHGSGRMDAVFVALALFWGSAAKLSDLANAGPPSAKRHSEMRDQRAAYGAVIRHRCTGCRRGNT
jgi:urease accessory protein